MFAKPNLPIRILVLFASFCCCVWMQARTFNMQDGSKINGEVVSFKNGMIVFAKDGGGRSLYSLSAFSPEDQAYLNQQYPQGDERQNRPGTATAKPEPTPAPQPQRRAQPSTNQQTAQTKPATGHPGLKTLRQGSVAPKIKGRIQGKSDYLSIDDLRGRIVVVHFWSTTVPQSIEEVKGLAYLHHKYKDRGFELIGVAMDASQRRLNAVEESVGVNWPMRLDEERETIEEWGVTALPTNVLVDQNGVILKEHISARELQYYLAEELGPLK